MKEKLTNSYKTWSDWQIWTVVVAIIIATAGLIVYEKYYRVFTSSDQASTVSDQPEESSSVISMFDWQKSASVWGGRDGHASVVFQDKIWVIGGRDKDDQSTNDVWSSADGTNWSKVSSNNLWPVRSSHQVVVFDNKIWIMGGVSSAGEELNDVWSSVDGIIWTKVTDAAAWPARANFASFVFDNKIMVMGGWSATSPQGGTLTYFNDVWSSTDGKNWIQLSADSAWSKRAYLSAYTFGDKVFVAGGLTSSPQRKFSDIYSSNDGKIWTKVGDLPDPRGGGDIINADGWLYFIDGYDNDQALSYSLYSKDGITWTQADNVYVGPSRAFHTATYFKNKIWLLGGTDFTDDRVNDLWSTGIIITK